jgi:outer membrane receptor for ferrienterochelin and colicin
MNRGRTRLMAWLCIAALWGYAAAPGQVTGKISGRVVEKGNRESLVGANISLPGTSLGAVTDKGGEYFILRVPPGIYTLRATMVGYQEVVVRNVRVLIDHTTQISVEMSETAVGMEEMVVTAERPVIQKDVTSSTQFVGAEEIEQLPVSDAREGVLLQTGVFLDPIPAIGGLGGAGRGEPRYAVRGGSQDQVKWYIDGIRTAALIEGRADRGGSFTNVNLNAIQEIQLVTGGFNAEYGEAQSGIVNVVTKEGGSKYFGSAEYIYGVPGQHHFGNYVYDPATQKEFLDHRKADGSLDTAWWTPYRQRQIYDYTKIPDYTVNASLGGPMFQGEGTNASFFVSSSLKREAYSLPHPRDTRNLENVMGNIAWQLRPEMRLRLSGVYNHEAHSTLQENGDFTSAAKYYRGWGSLIDSYTSSASLQFTHTISPALFYDIKAGFYQLETIEGESEYAVLGESLNPDIWGYQRYNGYASEPFDAWTPILRNHLKTGDLSLTGSVNWQVDRANLIKSGIEFRYLTVNEIEALRFPSFTTDPDLWLNRGLHETYHPLQLAAYVQDKMEFESMILNFGVRYDMFHPNRDWFYGSTLYNLSIDPLYSASLDANRDQLDNNGREKYSFANVLKQPRTPSRPFHMISPRIGVSFPISDATLLHFNYGHFYQMPPLDRMFEFLYFRPTYIVKNIIAARSNPSILHVPSNDGDPERVTSVTTQPLKPQKTVSFEVGVKHNFEDLAVLEVTGFYKDFTDQTEPRIGIFDRRVYGYDPFTRATTPNTFYASFFPGDYGDARGFEVTFRTLLSRWWTLDINYSFSRSTAGRASPGRVNLDSLGIPSYVYDTDVNKRIPVERSFNRPHMLRANLFLRYPEVDETSLWTTLMKGTSLSVLYRFASGQSFTYLTATDPPDTYDNYRYPSSQTVDMRLEKSMRLTGSHELTLSLRITNLLNTKNVRSIGDIYFDANCIKKYVETGEVSTVDGAGYDISWQTYYDARRVYLGVKYAFQ